MSGRGHHHGTSLLIERYDRDADQYGHHWAPVLDTSARDLLDRVAGEVTLPPDPVILDVGTGHGVLAFAALERWPGATVIATDASSGMLREARAAAALGGLGDDPRLRFVHAPAEALGVPDASVDLVVSSFVYQLVPDRAAAFAEAWRVLRPGGAIALVTWLEDGGVFEPGDAFDDAVVDLDLDTDDPQEEEARAGDFRSVRGAARELRTAGFARVAARHEELAFTWTPEAYLAYKQQYEDLPLYASLTEAQARALDARARERWAELPPEDWTFRAELVSALGRRPR